MRSSAAQYTDEFLFAKLHAAWSRACTGARLESLARAAGDAVALRRALESLGVQTADPATTPAALHLRLIADLAHIRGLAGAGAGFYDAFLGRYFLENLKLLLRRRAGLISAAELEALLIQGPGLEPLRLDVLPEARNIRLFHHALPPSPYKRALLPVLQEFDAGGDLFLADTRLDRLFFRELVAAAEAAPEGVREHAVALARLEVELFNIVTLLRGLELYRLPSETLAALLAADGLRISAAGWRELAGIADSARLVKKLPSPYAKALAPLAEQALPEREAALWALLHNEALRTFHDFRDLGAAVAAYPFLKQMETLGLVRIAEGARMRVK